MLIVTDPMMISLLGCLLQLILFYFIFKQLFNLGPLSHALRHLRWERTLSEVICLVHTSQKTGLITLAIILWGNTATWCSPKEILYERNLLLSLKSTCYCYYYLRNIFHSSPRGHGESRNNLSGSQTDLLTVIIKEVQGKFNFRV